MDKNIEPTPWVNPKTHQRFADIPTVDDQPVQGLIWDPDHTIVPDDTPGMH